VTRRGGVGESECDNRFIRGGRGLHGREHGADLQSQEWILKQQQAAAKDELYGVPEEQ
jgi:hypothetical protein